MTIQDDTDPGKRIDVQAESRQERNARIGGTALVILGALALLFVTAAAVFFTIASIVQANWAMAVVGALAVAALLWLFNRFMRVAANRQTKESLSR